MVKHMITTWHASSQSCQGILADTSFPKFYFFLENSNVISATTIYSQLHSLY